MRQDSFRRPQTRFDQSTLVPNPFVRRRKNAPLAVRPKRQPDPKQPWGLSSDDLKTVDSIAEPNSPVRLVPRSAPEIFPTSTSQNKSEALAQGTHDLTHVKPSGEAHMVDIGAKPDSRRVAIAYASVLFNNPEPFRLIFENNNKKGDVLSVSRIAGIMAAKRTSDLIPLCHPIAISKVAVDVKLEAPHVANPLYLNNKFGAVTVQAQVENTGPTGVEMEALTAASTAALTVYDMCKAVDRGMRIGQISLVYKSGGKSGLYANAHWAPHVGRQFFIERGFEVPDIKALKDV